MPATLVRGAAGIACAGADSEDAGGTF